MRLDPTSRFLHSLLKGIRTQHNASWGVFYRHVEFSWAVKHESLQSPRRPIAKLVSEGISADDWNDLPATTKFARSTLRSFATGQRVFFNCASNLGTVASRGNAPYIDIPPAFTELQRNYCPAYAPCVVNYPMVRKDGEILGVICIGYPYTPEQRTIATVYEYLRSRAENSLAGISSLTGQETADRLARVTKQIHNCTTLPDLYSCCVKVIPTILFDANNGSIFSPIKDDTGKKYLVLRGSSHLKTASRKNLESYTLDSAEGGGLTQWVSRNRVPLRVVLPLISSARDCIDPKLRWSNKIPDSEDHRNYLACPIQSVATGFLGVLRIVDRDKPFSERAEVTLRTICEDLIAPKLHALKHADVTESVIGYLKGTKLPSTTATALDENQFCRQLSARLYQRLGARDVGGLYGAASSGLGKVIIINRLSTGPPRSANSNEQYSDRFIRHVTVEGDLDELGVTNISFDRLLNLEKTVTEYAITNHDRVVYIHDRHFEATRHGFAFCRHAQSVIGCDISFGNLVYGAILVFSNALDLAPDIDGTLLELLALQCAEYFYRGEVAQQALSGAGLRHDVLGIVNIIENTYDQRLKALEKLGTPLEQEWKDLVHWNGMVQHYIECLTRRTNDGASAYVDANSLARSNLSTEVGAICRLLKQGSSHLVNFDIDIAHDLEAIIDKSRVLYIIYNLVNNSLKHNSHSKPLSIKISAALLPTHLTDMDELTIYIADNGKGLPDDVTEFVNVVRGVEAYESEAVDPSKLSRKGIPLVKALLGTYRFRKGGLAQIQTWSLHNAEEAALRLGFFVAPGAIFCLKIPTPRTNGSL